MKRLYQITEKLQSEFEALKKVTTDKDNQVRTLQTAIGTMSAGNASLREENESECSVLDAYYKDVFKKRSSTRALIDLNAVPPSDNAFEGSLTVLNVMFAKPLEFSNECKTVDLFTDRPQTRFAEEVASLQSLGLSTDNIEHAFFLRSYMQFQTDPSFCKDGILDNSSSMISLPPEGANAPRASVLKKTPKRFRNLFFTQNSSKRTTNVPNSALNQKEGGGLFRTEPLPSEVHLMLADFCQKNVHKNPAVPLISQFLTHVQNGLDSLDTALLRYSSPVYNICLLKVKAYKNGKQKVMKNKAHPVYEKWDSLISRTHFDAAYATTRVTFPWKGFYLPKGKICNQRDKYALFAFAYSIDLFLGALSLWPTDYCTEFQLDRKDSMRHYTLDNVRWLSRSDNMANKPFNGQEKSTFIKSPKDVVKILKACERSNAIFTEALGTLMKGYGVS
jgi:hypothetical protein